MPEVLIVDDNAINRQLAKTLLGRNGWTTLEADCGEIALEMLGQRLIPVLLLDISMPGLSGIETVHRIRQMPGGDRLYVVAYTAHAMEDEKRQILESGFDDILVKPVSKDSVLSIFEPLRLRLNEETAS